MSKARFKATPRKRTPAVRAAKPEADAVVALLGKHATKAALDGMARYGIPSENAIGVPMGTMMRLAKGIGRDHALALALWEVGTYESRTMAALVDEPEQVTAAQMERWCRGFDSWAICDTVCFKLFDRSPHAFGKVAKWAAARDEFVKRAGFALLACLAAHDRAAPDRAFSKYFPLIESSAGDDRNFVKKGILWAIRVIGMRSPALNAQAVVLARRLCDREEPAARWIGRAAIRELGSPAHAKRVAARIAKNATRARGTAR